MSDLEANGGETETTDLLKRCRESDPEALRELLADHLDWLTSVCAPAWEKSCGLAPRTRDHVQDAVLRFLAAYTVQINNIAPSGLNLPSAIPADQTLLGPALYLQVLEMDTGASAGVSFTPGLEIDIAY